MSPHLVTLSDLADLRRRLAAAEPTGDFTRRLRAARDADRPPPPTEPGAGRSTTDTSARPR